MGERKLPADYSEPDADGKPHVTVVPLARLARELGCGFLEAAGIARQDGMLLDAWLRPLGATFEFPPEHRFWVPEAWLMQTVEARKALVR